MRWTLLTLLMACSDHQPVQEGEVDSAPVDAAPVDAAPDCGCVGPGFRTVMVFDHTQFFDAQFFGPLGADICGIEVRCGDRVLMGTRAEVLVGTLYCSDCWGDAYFQAEAALDAGERCRLEVAEGERPDYVVLGESGVLWVEFGDAGPCGLADCEITIREADTVEEFLDPWEVYVCDDMTAANCVLTSAGRESLDGSATVDCCTCEPR